MKEFNRGLKSEFIHQLAEEAKKDSWWADVLSDPKLFVAVREEYLNVYWRGHSLFLVKPGSSGLKVTTHPKFLVNPELSAQVSLVEGKFDVKQGGFVGDYERPKTLPNMKRAADLFSEQEKTGCHEIILHNPQVIDCEIAFPKDGGPDNGAPRVDLLSLKPDGTLVFWEAKHFNNGELRAARMCRFVNKSRPTGNTCPSTATPLRRATSTSWRILQRSTECGVNHGGCRSRSRKSPKEGES